MLKNAGVYTAECPSCHRSVLIHLASDGSISPNKCSACEAEFESLDNGEQPNTFVIVAKTKPSKVVVNEEVDPVRSREGSQRASASNGAEEKPKEKKLTVKTQKDSFKMWRKD